MYADVNSYGQTYEQVYEQPYGQSYGQTYEAAFDLGVPGLQQLAAPSLQQPYEQVYDLGVPGLQQLSVPGLQQFGLPGIQQLPQSAPVVSATEALTRKRPREEDEGGEDPAKRLAASSPEVLFRLLVAPNRIGKVIGKQGMQIKQLREETGAHIKIAEPLSSVEERVVLISSKDEPGQPHCAAERALVRVAMLVIEPETGDKLVTATIGPQHHGGPNMTRLLIAGSQAGSVIGKGGATIKEIRESSGANVRILQRDQLPLCVSAAETDRLVQMSGEIPQVQKALELVAAKLRENPAREVIPNHPNYCLTTNMARQQLLLAQAGFTGYPFPTDNTDPLAMAAYGSMLSQDDLLGGYITSVPIIPKVTAEMRVPSSLVGGVIGRGGANITHIRQLSGASVKVTGQKDGTAERIIYFEGTSEQVSAAQSLVQAFLVPQQNSNTFVQ
eukprot:c21823_g1_i1 orf=401-1729(+)